uniref:Kynureninase n=1 Tax=Syphacia muris TaxID=451379 RepID=A0A0N5AWH2_9BILA
MDIVKRLSEKIGNGSVEPTSYEFALALDKQDKLRNLRDEFYYPKMKDIPVADRSLVDPEADSIYMCGNSLGLLAKPSEKYMKEQFEKWSKLGVLGHTTGPLPWAHCDEAAVERVAKLAGAKAVEVALMNSLTVNLHCLLTAFYKPTKERYKILMEDHSFPTDYYAIESQISLHGYNPEESIICLKPRQGEECLRTEDIIEVIEKQGSSIAIVFFCGIHYYTGEYFDMELITKIGHSQGCLVGWDLAHAFANVPLHLHDWDCDFAVWCTYKYASSGAGGIGGAFVHERYKNDNRLRLTGWWGHKTSTRFNMDNKLELEEGAAGYRISTPPIMQMIPLLGALDVGVYRVISKTSIEELREKSLLLTGYLEYLINYHTGSSGTCKNFKNIHCKIITPSNPERRGCQLSLKLNIDITDVCIELGRRGVLVDKRHPNVIRVTPVHLYNSFTDVHRFVSAFLDCLKVFEEKNAVL